MRHIKQRDQKQIRHPAYFHSMVVISLEDAAAQLKHDYPRKYKHLAEMIYDIKEALLHEIEHGVLKGR